MLICFRCYTNLGKLCNFLRFTYLIFYHSFYSLIEFNKYIQYCRHGSSAGDIVVNTEEKKPYPYQTHSLTDKMDNKLENVFKCICKKI